MCLEDGGRTCGKVRFLPFLIVFSFSLILEIVDPSSILVSFLAIDEIGSHVQVEITW